MNFKTALGVSLIIHLLLFTFFMLVPDLPKNDSKGMRYYVNYVNFSGVKSGGRGGVTKIRKASKKVTKKANKSKVVAPKEKKASLRDLSVKKNKQKSKLRYPDKKSKRKVEKDNAVQSVTVKRKVKKQKEDKGNSGEGTKNLNRSRLLEEGEEALSAGLGGSGGGTGVFFPYAYYVEALKNKISANWFRGAGSSLNAVVYFRIYKNGNIEKLQIEQGSGSSSFDLSALRAVKSAEPFPPLPDDYSKEYLSVFLKFE